MVAITWADGGQAYRDKDVQSEAWGPARPGALGEEKSLGMSGGVWEAEVGGRG